MADLSAWLTELGLSKYAAAFAEAEVTYADLPDLTDEDLREIGLPVGPRRKVRTAIDRMAGAAAAATPPAPDPVTSVERRNLTVLFVDLVGSSQLASRLDTEDVREVILAYQRTITDVIERAEVKGFVAKFMGDGALCYFGWPTAHEDDPERAP